MFLWSDIIELLSYIDIPGGKLMELKAFAARRERCDLRCSLKLPEAVYIFPQKSHLKFLNN